jgi:hypothetical protein
MKGDFVVGQAHCPTACPSLVKEFFCHRFSGGSGARFIGKLFDNFSSMSAPKDCLKQFVPVPRPHCHQIMGIVGKESWRRDIRNWTFQYYYLFIVEAVGTENVSFPKPVGFAVCPVDRSHRLSNLLFAIHPTAQFLSSVGVNNSDLIFITVFVRHLFSPER